MKIDYRKLLTIWIALGVFIGGYLMIYPIEHRRHKTNINGNMRSWSEDGKEGQIILLMTLVGGICIYGFGSINKKK
ncbi:hypothetical protein L3073_12715 [Ancylomarina sp. DW003]|nr:hypothetical protein [Ancylomarina sp. DW003]MDE5423073.1 hypothetical protein [Ancylomarina sp. DW003]